MNPSDNSQSNSPADATSTDHDLPRRVDQLQRELTTAHANCEELQRVLASERVQLGRTFELFERDRRMLGFEFHDGIVQDLTAALMYLQAGINELNERRVVPPESLNVCERVVVGCIEEARRLISGLQPPQLSEHGLVAAIEALAEEVRQRGVANVEVRIERTIGNLSPPLEIAVYRTVQESLNNVWQHSQAGRAEVSLQLVDGNIQIVVCDDGIGFSVTNVTKHHYGLLGIRERAQLFGGQAVIESQPGKGTTVRATLPLGPS